MIIKAFDSESAFRYKQISTFFEDFSVAEYFGLNAIENTYERCFQYWKDDYRYLTELVMVLNGKSWQHADGYVAKTPMCNLYTKLYNKLSDWCYDNLDDEALKYFIRTTD